MFSEACVKNSVHRGGAFVANRGMRGEGAMCGEVRGAMCGEVGGGSDGHRSGRYESYWNPSLSNYCDCVN